MSKLRKWLCTSLLTVVATAPVMAGSDDAVPANNGTGTNATAAEPAPNPALNPTSAIGNSNVTALLGVLVMKGVLAPAEANAIQGAAPEAEFQLLVEALTKKGLLSAADVAAATPAAQPATAAVSEALASPATQSGQAATTPQTPQMEKPVPRTVVAAIAPVRVNPVDPPVKDGLVAAFKLGPVKMTPYGFIKATVVHDSSDPRGDDFVLPGFLNADTGPTTDPAFHVKARSTRFGANLEWPDISPKIELTGRIEGDFEGNFSRADNRNVSAVRSSMASIRLAFARLDYAASENTDLYFEGGQDWILYGSTILPNILETTQLQAYFGTQYERSPQLQFGLVQKLGGSRNWKFSPAFAVSMPSEGNVPADATITSCAIPATFVPGTATTIGCTSAVTDGTANQLGYGERQGSDSNNLEYTARAVLQFQLDPAPAVAPAYIMASGFETHRAAIALHSAIAAPAGADAAEVAAYDAVKAAFPTGAEDRSEGYGGQVGVSLPTRWATVVASAYRGGDLRFMFGGQTLSYFSDAGGLTGTVSVPTIDRSGTGTIVFGTNAAGQIVVAPQRAIRAYGGFIQLGLPLSRWFNADPKGHNAGWQLYFNHGLDQVVHADFAKAKDIGADGAGPYKSTLNAVTLFYRLNPWVQFGFEESLYSSYALPNDAGVFTPNTSVAGVPSRTWRDLRSEFGPIFTF
ncbi:MAG TPA: hypothetical protein VGP35_08425 [Terriglobales bacterium]|nr:hypothetical protein [Terriglobales bacterium]